MCSFENQPNNILHRETHRAYAEDWKGEEGKKDREGLGHITEEDLNCWRERDWGKMPLCENASVCMGKTDIAVAKLPHEAATSLIYKCCLLAHDVEICNLELEGLQSTFTYL